MCVCVCVCLCVCMCVCVCVRRGGVCVYVCGWKGIVSFYMTRINVLNIQQRVTICGPN